MPHANARGTRVHSVFSARPCPWSGAMSMNCLRLCESYPVRVRMPASFATLRGAPRGLRATNFETQAAPEPPSGRYPNAGAGEATGGHRRSWKMRICTALDALESRLLVPAGSPKVVPTGVRDQCRQQPKQKYRTHHQHETYSALHTKAVWAGA
jgi:hypothetical protein